MDFRQLSISRARRFYTNKPCCGPKRGHGSVQPRFAFEGALDELAEALDMDPIEIRRFATHWRAGTPPSTGSTSPPLDCVSASRVCVRQSSWDERWAKLPSGRGLGVACSMYISGTASPIYPNEMPQSGVQILADRSGRITISCGASDIGQGSDGMLTYIIAEETGLSPDHIIVLSHDTDLTPVDLGAYSSRVTYMCGIAAQEAGGKLAAAMRTALAEHWEIPEEQVRKALGFWFDKSSA